MKVLFWIVGALISLVVAAIPETAMYFTYRLIQPQSDLARVLVLGIFWLGGAGICVAFWILGVMLFAAVTKAALE